MLCKTLGLEFYIGPPRKSAVANTDVPPELLYALDLPKGTSITEVVKVIERLLQDAGSHENLTTAAQIEALRTELTAQMADMKAVFAEAGKRKDLPDKVPVDLIEEDDEPEPRVRVFNASSDDEMAEVEVDYDKVIVPFAKENLAAAGVGAWVYDNEEDMRVAVPRSFLPGWASSRSLTCVRASGDSMEPEINDGDLILLDQSNLDPIDGEVFVICSEDCLVVKRVRKTDDGWQMTSDNPKYKSRPLGEWDQNVGRVAWSGPLPATEAGG